MLLGCAPLIYLSIFFYLTNLLKKTLSFVYQHQMDLYKCLCMHVCQPDVFKIINTLKHFFLQKNDIQGFETNENLCLILMNFN